MTDGPAGDPTELSAAEAFGLLAHETRLAAMRVLWDENGPLTFTAIADRAGIPDTGNFNYHLGKLVGYFLRKEGDTYALTLAGRQAMAAVSAGTLTDLPLLEPTVLNRPCPWCEADVRIAHFGDKLRVTCTECPGTFGGEDWNQGSALPHPPGTITVLPFPPAGIENRTPQELLDASLVRLASRWRDLTYGTCPDCGDVTTSTASVCTDHDRSGVCTDCGMRFVGVRHISCDGCGQPHTGGFPLNLFAHPDLVMYFLDHGVDPLKPSWAEAAVPVVSCNGRPHDGPDAVAELEWHLDDEPMFVLIGEDGAVIETQRG